MTREDALKTATERVNALATNTRGYQDGVRLPDKVEAVERFARFLAGEDTTSSGEMLRVPAEHRAALTRILRSQINGGPSEYDDAAAALLAEMGDRQ